MRGQDRSTALGGPPPGFFQTADRDRAWIVAYSHCGGGASPQGYFPGREASPTPRGT